jgi:hypothetical protein
MKKTFTIALLLVYVTLSVGLNIMVHTCGGESDTLLATTNVEDPCGCNDMAAADKCCTTEVTTVKLDADQKANITSVEQQLSLCMTAPVCAAAVVRPAEPELASRILTFDSPPPSSDLCIDNSILRI